MKSLHPRQHSSRTRCPWRYGKHRREQYTVRKIVVLRVEIPPKTCELFTSHWATKGLVTASHLRMFFFAASVSASLRPSKGGRMKKWMTSLLAAAGLMFLTQSMALAQQEMQPCPDTTTGTLGCQLIAWSWLQNPEPTAQPVLSAALGIGQRGGASGQSAPAAPGTAAPLPQTAAPQPQTVAPQPQTATPPGSTSPNNGTNPSTSPTAPMPGTNPATPGSPATPGPTTPGQTNPASPGATPGATPVPGSTPEGQTAPGAPSNANPPNNNTPGGQTSPSGNGTAPPPSPPSQ